MTNVWCFNTRNSSLLLLSHDQKASTSPLPSVWNEYNNLVCAIRDQVHFVVDCAGCPGIRTSRDISPGTHYSRRSEGSRYCHRIISTFFFYSVRTPLARVAVSTMRRQSSRIAAFLQADARPMFCWPRSASTARSQVWLVFLTVASNLEAAPESPQRQHGGGPLDSSGPLVVSMR